jgi:hypothetical protein
MDRSAQKDIDTRGFLTCPVQVTRVHKGQIATDGDTFHLAGNAPSLLDVTHYPVEPIRKERIVLDVWPGHETRQQVGFALVEDLVVDDLKHASNVISCHVWPFRR